MSRQKKEPAKPASSQQLELPRMIRHVRRSEQTAPVVGPLVPEESEDDSLPFE